MFISATTAYCTVPCHTMLLHLTMQWYRIMMPLNKALKEMLIAPMQGSFLTPNTPSSVISCASILFMGNICVRYRVQTYRHNFHSFSSPHSKSSSTKNSPEVTFIGLLGIHIIIQYIVSKIQLCMEQPQSFIGTRVVK